MVRRLTLWIAALLLSGCASLPRVVDKPFSVTLPASTRTVWGKLVADSAEGRQLSGVRLIASGDEALASLITLADHAERSIDIQQYIIEQDETSRAVLRHVRAAAERGVRVRILIDDLNTVGKDRRLLHLAEEPNLEVRVFNPFPAGRLSYMTRFAFSALEIPRINHRMHNKLFVVDDAIAVTGGRNIGDQYFVRSNSYNFVDLDVIVAGRAVPDLSASFDAFWNSRFAYPIASVASPEAEQGAAASATDPVIPDAAKFLDHDLEQGRLNMTWVPVAVLADAPAKIAGEEHPEQFLPVASSIGDLMGEATSEVTVISPYFVPGESGVRLMGDLVKRGVGVRVLTNSLATTDSPLVHIGYSRYRRALLREGVELFELRPVPGQKKARFHPFKSGHASLHAKAVVVDHHTVFIGSMNMDARSAHTNSELGLVIRSTLIANQVEALFDDAVSDASYSLELTPDRRGIVWTEDEGNIHRIWHKDPETSFALRLGLKLLAPLAADGLL